MKKIILLIVFPISCLLHSCSEESPRDSKNAVRFTDTSYSALLEKAKTENKKVFIEFEASWCGTCKKFNNIVLTDSLVGDYYNSTFVNYKVDIDSEKGKELVAKYGIEATPTFVYTDNEGKELKKIPGFKEANEFVLLGREVN